MTRARRVLIIVSFANLAGAQIAALRVARGLRDRGHDPKVVALYQQSPIDSPDHPYEVVLPTAEPSAFGYLRIAWDIVRLARREKPHVVITFLPLANVLGQAAAILGRVGGRVVSHRMPVRAASPLLRILDTAWARLGVYTRVVAVSEAVRASCSHYPAWLLERTVVVHNGLRDWRPSILTREQARLRFGVPAGTFALVAVGRLVEQKNYPLMLEIIRRLDDAVLLIAGEGPVRHQIENAIGTLGGKVRLLGAVSRRDIPDLLAAADVFIQTSTYEGQSNSILEALESCVPIVAHDIPEQRETIVASDGGVAGSLVPLGELEAWIAAIECFRDSPTAARAAREAASRRREAFRYEAMISGFEKSLDD